MWGVASQWTFGRPSYDLIRLTPKGNVIRRHLGTECGQFDEFGMNVEWG